MNKGLKQVDVVFENCDVINVPSANVELFDVKLTGRWLYHNWSCRDEQKKDYTIGHSDAEYVRICVKLTGLSDEHKQYLQTRKDITHLDILYTDGTNEYIRVPEPFFFIDWFPNPYQITCTEDNKNEDECVTITIEPHWSILCIRYWLKDRLHQVFHRFPIGLRIMLAGYWWSFKRHFRCRH